MNVFFTHFPHLSAAMVLLCALSPLLSPPLLSPLRAQGTEAGAETPPDVQQTNLQYTAVGSHNPTRQFNRVYAILSPQVGLLTIGKWQVEDGETGETLESGKLRGDLRLGLRLAAYKPIRNGLFQIGGTLAYDQGGDRNWTRTMQSGTEEYTTLRQFTFAVSFKAGTLLSPCFWLGGALDFGPIVHVTRAWEGEAFTETAVTSDADIGIHFFPHIAADYLLVNRDDVKFGVSASLGVILVPKIADIESSLTNQEDMKQYMTPVVTLGLMLGM